MECTAISRDDPEHTQPGYASSSYTQRSLPHINVRLKGLVGFLDWESFGDFGVAGLLQLAADVMSGPQETRQVSASLDTHTFEEEGNSE